MPAVTPAHQQHPHNPGGSRLRRPAAPPPIFPAGKFPALPHPHHRHTDHRQGGTVQPLLFGNDLYVTDLRAELAERSPGYTRRDAAQLERIVIHHDAAWFPSDERRPSAERQRIEAVHRYHQDANGWPAISYHFYAFPSGRVYYVGDWNTVRYHTAGPDDQSTPEHVSRYNEDGIALVLAGDYTHHPPDERFLQHVRHAVANVQYAFGRFLSVHGHQELSATSCPGNTWPEWAAAITVPEPQPEQ